MVTQTGHSTGHSKRGTARDTARGTAPTLIATTSVERSGLDAARSTIVLPVGVMGVGGGGEGGAVEAGGGMSTWLMMWMTPLRVSMLFVTIAMLLAVPPVTVLSHGDPGYAAMVMFPPSSVVVMPIGRLSSE